MLFYNDTSVVNNQTYFYFIIAMNGIGNSSSSDNVNGTPRGPPTPPLGLEAIADVLYIDLSWTAPANDGGYTIFQYRIYRGTGAGKTFLTSVGGGTLTYRDNSVSSGQTYYYHVIAVNLGGDSPASNEAKAIFPTPTPQSWKKWRRVVER